MVAITGGVLLVAVVVVLIFYMRRHMKRLERKAEQAYPGPLDDAKPGAGSRQEATNR